MKTLKTVILMNSWHIGANIVLQKIQKDPHFHLHAILVRPIWKSKFQNSWIQRMGMGNKKIGIFGFVALFALTIVHFFPMIFFDIFGIGVFFGVKKYIKSPFTIAKEQKIPLYVIDDICDPKTIEILHNLAPDILLSNHFNQIIPEEILSLSEYGTFNLHPGKIPQYKGLFPTFWAMLKGEKILGVTFHKIDTGIDTGPIIEEKIFKISEKTTLYEAIQKSSHHLSVLFRKFMKRLAREKNITTLRKKGGETFSFPESKHLEDFSKKGKKFW